MNRGLHILPSNTRYSHRVWKCVWFRFQLNKILHRFSTKASHSDQFRWHFSGKILRIHHPRHFTCQHCPNFALAVSAEVQVQEKGTHWIYHTCPLTNPLRGWWTRSKYVFQWKTIFPHTHTLTHRHTVVVPYDPSRFEWAFFLWETTGRDTCGSVSDWVGF